MGIFRKKEAPEELPNLASDQLSVNGEQEAQEFESKFKPLRKRDICSTSLNIPSKSLGLNHKSAGSEQGY